MQLNYITSTKYTMLKRIGYTNLMMLVMGIAIMYFIVDFRHPSSIDIVLMILFGLTALIHVARFIMFIFIKKEDKR